MKKRVDTIKENEEFVKNYDDSKYKKPSVTADIVIFGMFDSEENNYRKLSQKELKVLLIQRDQGPFEGCYALPGGFVRSNETIVDAAKRELGEETHVQCDFLEQFGTYSDPKRDPRRWVISNGFMALMDAGSINLQAGDDASDAKWFDVSFEEAENEWKLQLSHGEEKIFARLKNIASRWDVKQKFESVESNDIAFDHQIIIADAIMQLRKWINETHIAFRLLPEKFTFRELQQIYETVLDTELLVPAFRRKMAFLVEDTGEVSGDAGHRPAVLYRERDGVDEI
ncbi:NUDIX hydrolase [Ruminococcus sp. AM22-13]|nr:NUDIX hydrolase [Ruminococcus sp. AM22-13]